MRFAPRSLLSAALLATATNWSPSYAQHAPWTGFYVGGNASYLSARANINESAADLVLATYDTRNALPGVSVDKSGFGLGLQAGYGWRFGNLITGLEADYTWFNKNKSANIVTVVPGFVDTANAASSRIGGLATFRGKLGFEATPSLLLYATGGLATGNVSHARFTGTGGFGSVPEGSVSKTATGWALGVGGEYALSWNVGLKLEYLHFNLGDSKFTTAVNGAVRTSASNDGDILRLGVNYRF